MRIVQILLRPHTDGDKPQLVFETINGTGKQLEAADLIRNFILMDKDYEEQTDIFKNYWKPIEQNTRFDNQTKTTDFIWYFLTLKEEKNLKQADVYSNFKTYISKINDTNLKDTLEEMKIFSGYYKQLAFGEEGIYESYYETLRNLKQTTCYAYLMSLMDYYENHKDTFENDMHTILDFIINYYIRRLLNKNNTGEYANFFPTVDKKIKFHMDKGKAYKDSFYRVFANNAPTIPTNEVLENTLKASGYNFYKLKFVKYLFSELVNKDHKEKIKMEKITIEHIMPQKLTDTWRRMLGKYSEEVHTNYLHSLGNLTVTGYNSELGNQAFQDKKQIFAESNISLNRYFENVERWNKQEIQKRTKYLSSELCKILDLKVNLKKYQNEIKMDEHHSLEECLSILKRDFGYKPIHFKIKNDGRSLEKYTWRELLFKIATYCYKTNPTIIHQMAADSTCKFLSTTESDKNKKIADDVFVTLHYSSEQIMKYVKVLLTKYGIADDFEIKLR